MADSLAAALVPSSVVAMMVTAEAEAQTEAALLTEDEWRARAVVDTLDGGTRRTSFQRHKVERGGSLRPGNEEESAGPKWRF